MSDISRLDLLVDSSKAVNSLNGVQQHLNKTEAAANSLQNTLKKIGLGIGLTALFKESLKLSNSFDALNKRVNQFFGSSANNAIKDLTNNFTLANRQAKELLTTAGKFGTATGFGGDALTKFSTDLTKLATDIAAFHAIDDVNTVLERFGLATLGRTQGLREFGVQIDTTSQKFKDQVAAIQEATGATEAQARQMAILQEAQRQLAYTQGSAAEQINSGWQQLNNLFSNFKDILSKVGGIFSTIFAPILKMLNDILQVPFVKTVAAWTIAITALLIPLNSIAKAINKSADSLNEASLATSEFGSNFQKTTRKNYHEATKFENALRRTNNLIRSQQNLRLDKKVLQQLNAADVDITKITDKLKKGTATLNTILPLLDTMAGKLLQTDISTIKVTSTIKNALLRVDELINNFKPGKNSKADFTKLTNLKLLISKLGITSDETSSDIDVLNKSLKDVSDHFKDSGLIGFFNNIASGFNAISNIKITGSLKWVAALFIAIGKAVVAILPYLAAIAGLVLLWHEATVVFSKSLTESEKKLREEAEEFKKKIIDAQDPTIFYKYDQFYESWVYRFFSLYETGCIKFENWFNGKLNDWFGTDFSTNKETEEMQYRRNAETQVLADHFKAEYTKYVDNVNDLNHELEKLWAEEVEDKRTLLEQEIKMHADTYKKLQDKIKSLVDQSNNITDQINANWSQAWKLGPQLAKIRKEEIEARKLLNQTAMKGLNASKELAELNKTTKTETIDRDIIKSVLSPVQTAVNAVSANSVEAIRLQSRQEVDNKEVQLIELTKEANQTRKEQMSATSRFFDEAMEGIRKIYSGENSIVPVNV